jgi:hypothetical protein
LIAEMTAGAARDRVVDSQKLSGLAGNDLPQAFFGGGMLRWANSSGQRVQRRSPLAAAALSLKLSRSRCARVPHCPS